MNAAAAGVAAPPADTFGRVVVALPHRRMVHTPTGDVGTLLGLDADSHLVVRFDGEHVPVSLQRWVLATPTPAAEMAAAVRWTVTLLDRAAETDAWLAGQRTALRHRAAGRIPRRCDRCDTDVWIRTASVDNAGYTRCIVCDDVYDVGPGDPFDCPGCGPQPVTCRGCRTGNEPVTDHPDTPIEVLAGWGATVTRGGHLDDVTVYPGGAVVASLRTADEQILVRVPPGVYTPPIGLVDGMLVRVTGTVGTTPATSVPGLTASVIEPVSCNELEDW